MKYYDLYINLIVLLKVIFFILSIIHIYYKIKDNKKNTNNNNDNSNKKSQQTQQYIEYLRSRCEFVVTILMSFLLIYIFNPLYPKLYLIDGETKVLLFAFGFILLLTAKWSDFINVSNLFVLFQDFLA